jgi:hypothetical protein
VRSGTGYGVDQVNACATPRVCKAGRAKCLRRVDPAPKSSLSRVESSVGTGDELLRGPIEDREQSNSTAWRSREEVPFPSQCRPTNFLDLGHSGSRQRGEPSSMRRIYWWWCLLRDRRWLFGWIFGGEFPDFALCLDAEVPCATLVLQLDPLRWGPASGASGLSHGPLCRRQLISEKSIVNDDGDSRGEGAAR